MPRGSSMSPQVDEVVTAAEAAGLAFRGGFALTVEERAGPLAEARSVALFGMIGAAQWPAFAASPEAVDGLAHPLDRWSRRILTALAEQFGAVPLFPFEGPPYWPFQRWAQRAEPVHPSPLGLLIHPRYGLSHSYRGALAFSSMLEFAPSATEANPCDTCAERPCLAACPVGAFSPAGYDVARCAGYLEQEIGAACVQGGCLARQACPVGREHVQAPEQARFHISAFLAARRVHPDATFD